MRHLRAFNADLGSACDQSFGAKVRWNFDQQIAASCAVFTGCSSRFESLNDGARLSHFIGGRCHHSINGGDMTAIDRALGNVSELSRETRIGFGATYVSKGVRAID